MQNSWKCHLKTLIYEIFRLLNLQPIHLIFFIKKENIYIEIIALKMHSSENTRTHTQNIKTANSRFQMK